MACGCSKKSRPSVKRQGVSPVSRKTEYAVVASGKTVSAHTTMKEARGALNAAKVQFPSARVITRRVVV